MQPWSGLPCSRVSQSDEADCDSVLSSCERSGTAIREKTGCCGPRDPVVQHLTLGQPPQACSVLAGVLAPGPWVLGLSSNIDNCVVIIVGRHQGPASPVTNYQPTNWVKADSETITRPPGASQSSLSGTTCKYALTQPARCQEGQMQLTDTEMVTFLKPFLLGFVLLTLNLSILF